jgi:hypothetical protein
MALVHVITSPKEQMSRLDAEDKTYMIAELCTLAGMRRGVSVYSHAGDWLCIGGSPQDDGATPDTPDTTDTFEWIAWQHVVSCVIHLI